MRLKKIIYAQFYQNYIIPVTLGYRLGLVGVPLFQAGGLELEDGLKLTRPEYRLQKYKSEKKISAGLAESMRVGIELG